MLVYVLLHFQRFYMAYSNIIIVTFFLMLNMQNLQQNTWNYIPSPISSGGV